MNKQPKHFSKEDIHMAERYSHASHNDAVVNEKPHIKQWSYKIISSSKIAILVCIRQCVCVQTPVKSPNNAFLTIYSDPYTMEYYKKFKIIIHEGSAN